MSDKVLIFGAKGWLAAKFAAFLPNAELTNVNIANYEEVSRVLDKVRPVVVINAAGKTGRPNIDWCERPENRAATRQSNVFGPMTLANTCGKRGIYLVHLSSGCIFNGQSPGPDGWTETDTPNPVSFYSETKVLGEFHIMNRPCRSLIVRLRMPVDDQPNPRNLITKLAGYSRVIDVVNSVTVVNDFLVATAHLIERRETGIFNVVNPHPVGHREILDWYRQLVDPSHTYELIPLEKMYADGLAVAGRSNCVLNGSKLARTGVMLAYAPAAIKNCLREYARALGR